ncbi:MAG: hypothetical protein ABIW76_12875 [Fibrobacteria bacterium]
MSNYTIPYQAPEGAGGNESVRIPAYVLGAAAGFAFLFMLPGQARADGYGHAEISLGFPHGSVTVGKTWDDNPRQVVVEEVTHKLPDPDFEDEDEDEARYDGDADEPDQVIIEKRIERPRVKKVTIIERYVEPVHCDREVNVVRRVYVEPRYCERPDVVVYRSSPSHVIYAPSRTVIVAPGHGYRGGYHGYRDSHRGGYHGGYRGDHGTRSYDRGSNGPRNLFPEASGRPVRTRGVQQQHLVQVGGHGR